MSIEINLCSFRFILNHYICKAIGLEKSHHFITQSEVKPKTSVTHSQTFPLLCMSAGYRTGMFTLGHWVV